MTDGNSPAAARSESGPQTRAPTPGLTAPRRPRSAPGPQIPNPNLLLRFATRSGAHAVLRPRPAPATTFPGSFQQWEETRGGREKTGERGISPRGGGGCARLRVAKAQHCGRDTYRT